MYFESQWQLVICSMENLMLEPVDRVKTKLYNVTA